MPSISPYEKLLLNVRHVALRITTQLKNKFLHLKRNRVVYLVELSLLLIIVLNLALM